MFMKAERKKGAKLNEVKPVYIYIRSRIVSGGQYLVSLPLPNRLFFCRESGIVFACSASDLVLP